MRLVAGDTTLLLAAVGNTYDGRPVEACRTPVPQFALRQGDPCTTLGTLHVSASICNARWRPTEQISQRAIGVQIADASGSLDGNLKAKTEREIFNACLDGDDWRASVYAQHYDWNLTSNFTFFLDDPVNGVELV